MKGQPLRTSLREAGFLIFCHVHDNRQLTTLGLLKLRVAICKQLNAAPYLLGGWCAQPWSLLREETVPGVRCAGQPAISRQNYS